MHIACILYTVYTIQYTVCAQSVQDSAGEWRSFFEANEIWYTTVGRDLLYIDISSWIALTLLLRAWCLSDYVLAGKNKSISNFGKSNAFSAQMRRKDTEEFWDKF